MRFPYSLLSKYRYIKDIQKNIYSKFLSDQRIEAIAEIIDTNILTDGSFNVEMIKQYKWIKERLESLMVDSINTTVELELYLRGVDKVLNIRKKKIAKGFSKAIESQRS